jgi:hypothetical protein
MKLESANVKNSESAKWVDRAAGAIIAGLAAAGLKALGVF